MSRDTLQNICLSCPELWQVFFPFLMKRSVLEVEDTQPWTRLLRTDVGLSMRPSIQQLKFLQLPNFSIFNYLFVSPYQQLKSLTINCSSDLLTLEASETLFTGINLLPHLRTLRFFVDGGFVQSELANTFKNQNVETLAINFEKFHIEVINAIVQNFSKLKYIEISNGADVSALRTCLYSQTYFDGHVVRFSHNKNKEIKIYHLVDTKQEKIGQRAIFTHSMA